MLVAAVAIVSGPAWGGPAIDDKPVERVAKLEVRPKRAPPAIVPAACPVPAGEGSGVSAADVIAELKKNNARRDEVLAAEAALDQERTQLVAERERLDALRLDLDLQRAELTGGPPPPDPSAAANARAAPAANDDDEVKNLSATVRVMKADKAAAVVTLLDRTLAARVMRTLSKPAAAAIYDRLPPDKAAGIMQIIAQAKEPQVAP